MAVTKGQAASDLSAAILEQASSIQFFQLIERLYRINDADCEHALDIHPNDELIRYEVNPSLGFPRSDVIDAWTENSGGRAHYVIQVAFMGLHGSSSPLPRHYLDAVACEPYEQEHGARVPFFDFFHHRLLTLLHRGWRKYRYFVRFLPTAADGFSQYVYSFIGLNDRDIRRETPLPWSRLLTYAGMMVTRSRAPSMVAGIISNCFELPEVEVKQWVERYVDIPDDQTNCLGKQNMMLGDGFTIGQRVLTVNTKFLVCIKQLDQQRYRDFLPSGAAFPQLCSLLACLLRDQLAYDLELELIPSAVPAFILDPDHGVHLGWTSFLIDQSRLQQATTVRIRGRN